MTRILKLQNEVSKHAQDIKPEDFDETDESDDDDSKEQRNSFDNLEKCKKLSKNISNDFKNLFSKVKSMIFPDEQNWRNWTVTDFKRYFTEKNQLLSIFVLA